VFAMAKERNLSFIKSKLLLKGRLIKAITIFQTC